MNIFRNLTFLAAILSSQSALADNDVIWANLMDQQVPITGQLIQNQFENMNVDYRQVGMVSVADLSLMDTLKDRQLPVLMTASSQHLSTLIEAIEKSNVSFTEPVTLFAPTGAYSYQAAIAGLEDESEAKRRLQMLAARGVKLVMTSSTKDRETIRRNILLPVAETLGLQVGGIDIVTRWDWTIPLLFNQVTGQHIGDVELMPWSLDAGVVGFQDKMLTLDAGDAEIVAALSHALKDPSEPSQFNDTFSYPPSLKPLFPNDPLGVIANGMTISGSDDPCCLDPEESNCIPWEDKSALGLNAHVLIKAQ